MASCSGPAPLQPRSGEPVRSWVVGARRYAPGRAGVPSLEPHGHPAEAGAPDPAGAVVSCTTSAPGRPARPALHARHASRGVLGPPRPRPAPRDRAPAVWSPPDRGQRRTGPPARRRSARRRRRPAVVRRRSMSTAPSRDRAISAITSASVGRAEQAAGPGVGGEVVQPHLDRHRPREQPGRPQPARDLPGVAVQDRRAGSSASTRSVSKVSSTEIDLVSRSGSTGRSSRAIASSTRPWACARPDDLG